MRLGDADRDALLEQLKRHAAAGRLSVEELERRVGIVLGADTREQASPALADLPPLPDAEPARRRGRGHGESDAVAADWEATDERFRDPRTNRIMRVWIDALGGRHYVPEQ